MRVRLYASAIPPTVPLYWVDGLAQTPGINP